MEIQVRAVMMLASLNCMYGKFHEAKRTDDWIMYATRTKKLIEPTKMTWDAVGMYSAGMKELLVVSDEITITIVLIPTKKGSNAS